MKEYFARITKEYFARITKEVPKHRLIIWWIFRALLIYAFIMGFVKKPFDITNPLQVGANFLCTFVFEIFQLLPKKNSLRHVPSVVQTYLIIGIFAGSFGGKYLNLYYSLQWWDIVLHFVGGGACVFFGYEIICAMMKRDNKMASVSIAVLSAIGFSFLATAGWELFEYTFDSISCASAAKNLLANGANTINGYVDLSNVTDITHQGLGDAQHWSWSLAAGTPKQKPMFNPYFFERYALMDTMADAVLNAGGAVLSAIFLKIYPYRHKGKYAMNID